MNPRAEAAFEAVSCIREFIRKHRDRDRFVHMLENDLDSLNDRLRPTLTQVTVVFTTKPN